MTKGVAVRWGHRRCPKFAWHHLRSGAKLARQGMRQRGRSKMIRRYGETIQRDRRYKARPGAYAILWAGGYVLTTFQAQPHPEFQLPGGGIDPKESPVRALHREVIEETGWTISTPRRLGAFRRFVYMPDYGFWAEKICHVYLARPCFRKSAPTEQHHTAIWLPPEDAVSKIANPGDNAFLRAVFRL